MNGYLWAAVAAAVAMFLLPSSSVQAASTDLTLVVDSDTSLYAVGEPVRITVSGPPSQISISVTGPDGGEVYRDDSWIDSSGNLTLTLPTVGLATGSYIITVNGSAGFCSTVFLLVEPFVEVSCTAVSGDGEPLSRPAQVYYYFNGSLFTLLVNASAPNSHLSVSVDLGWLGYGLVEVSPEGSGTWANGTLPDGSGWYAFIVNCTVPTEFEPRGVFETRVEAKAPGGSLDSATFLAALNFQPGDYDRRLGGTTTDWRGIRDFTNATGITLEFLNGSGAIARVTYVDGVNLCDPVTARSLFSLSEYLDAGVGRVFVGVSALPALDARAEVRFYGLSSKNQPGVLFDGVPAVMSGQSSGGPVRSLSWDPGSGSLTLDVERMGEIAADGDPPSLDYSDPLDGSYTGDPAATMCILVVDAISGVDPSSVVIQVDGKLLSPAVAPAGNGRLWVNATPDPLADGWHAFLLTVSDFLGNGAAMLVNIAVDTTPPEVASFMPLDGSYTGDPAQRISAEFTDQLSGVSNSTLFINSSKVAEWNGSSMEYVPTSGLGEGPCNATVVVSDMVGNSRAFTWSFTADLTPPRISYVHPENAMIVPYNDSVYANFEDNYGVDLSRISLVIDGTEVAGHANVTERALLYFPSPPLSRGMHEAVMTVYDLAGNNASRAWIFRIDDIPPVIIEKSPREGEVITSKAVTVSATLFDNLEVKPDLVKVIVDGVDRTPQSTVTKTRATCQLYLEYGEHTVEVVLFDTSYNGNTVSWSFTIAEPQPMPLELFRDILIMAVLVVGIIVALVLVFVLGNRRRQRY